MNSLLRMQVWSSNKPWQTEAVAVVLSKEQKYNLRARSNDCTLWGHFYSHSAALDISCHTNKMWNEIKTTKRNLNRTKKLVDIFVATNRQANINISWNFNAQWVNILMRSKSYGTLLKTRSQYLNQKERRNDISVFDEYCINWVKG